MKRRLFTMIAVSIMTLSSYAQIVSSTSRTINTTFEQEKYEVSYSRVYNRIYAGFGLGMASVSGEVYNEKFSTPTLTGPGSVEVGWNIGLPLLKTTDLFLETGLNLNYRFLEGDVDFMDTDAHIGAYGATVEVPVNLTYRFNIGRRMFVSPYAGMSVGFSTLTESDFGSWDNWRANPFFTGLQFGVNFDLKHFYIGVGWYKNLTNLMDDDNSKGYSETFKMGYSDIRLRVGYTFSKKTKKRIQ